MKASPECQQYWHFSRMGGLCLGVRWRAVGLAGWHRAGSAPCKGLLSEPKATSFGTLFNVNMKPFYRHVQLFRAKGNITKKITPLRGKTTRSMSSAIIGRLTQRGAEPSGPEERGGIFLQHHCLCSLHCSKWAMRANGPLT